MTIKRAYIIADQPHLLFFSGERSQSFEKLCGLGIIERQIYSLQRKGIEDITIITGFKADVAEQNIRNLPRVTCNLDFAYNEDWKAGTIDHVLKERIVSHEHDFFLLEADLVFAPGTIDILKDHDSQKNSVIIKQDPDSPGKRTPFFLRVNEEFAKYILGSAGYSIDQYVSEIDSEQLLDWKETGKQYYFSFSESRNDKSRLEKTLLNSLRKDIDGIASRFVNRNVSLFITRRLLNFNITPNHMSFITVTVGILSAFVVSSGDYWRIVAGSFLYQFASILDGCDGEIARIKFMQSKFGEWADTVADDICNHAFLIGLTINAYSNGQEVFAKAGLIGVLFSLGCTFMYYTQLILYYKSGDLLKIKMFYQKEEGIVPEAASLSTYLQYLVKRDFFVLFFFFLALAGLAHYSLYFFLFGSTVTFAVVFIDFILKIKSGMLFSRS